MSRHLIIAAALGAGCILAGCSGGGGGGPSPDSSLGIQTLQSDLFRERDGQPAVHESSFPTSGSAAYRGYANFGIGESASNQIDYAALMDVTVGFGGAGSVNGRIHNIFAGGYVITGGRTGYTGPVDGELIIGNGSLRYGQPHPALYPDIVADVDGTLRHPHETPGRPDIVRPVEGRLEGNFTGTDMPYLHGSFTNRDPQPFGAAFLGSFDAERQD